MLVRFSKDDVSFTFEMNQRDFRFLWFYHVVEFGLKVMTVLTSFLTKAWTKEYKLKWGYKA